MTNYRRVRIDPAMKLWTLGASEVVERFTNTVDSMFKRQDVLEQENQHLTQLRDWLLPMLMNGQVTVALGEIR